MSITKEVLKQVIFDQKEDVVLLNKEYIQRTAEANLIRLKKNREIIVLSGFRRCGKSVLLNQIRNSTNEKDFYLNFEDERLINFTLEDFQTLQETFIELFGVQKNYYFDEIQNISGWEMFLRRLYNSGNKLFITGSNANLFSEELGTKLTGRYISQTIYPISFAEYVNFKDKALTKKTGLSTTQKGQLKKLYIEYNRHGGIPEYIKYQQKYYLHSLYESIIYRDIVARYKISNADILKKMLYYLASNCGKEVTYSSIKKMLGVGSTTTISDYCGYVESSYLCFFVNKYSDSLKAQQQTPKKVYFIDHMLAKTLGFRVSEDYGLVLENLVFLELKRRNKDVYFYREKKECDFIIRENNQTVQVIQVCKDLSDAKTKEREFAGLIEAMARFSLSTGLIITDNENFTENISVKDKTYHIEVLPVWVWLL